MSVTPIKTVQDFNAKINSGKAVIIDFWAPWCGPCKAISPIFEKLAGERNDPNVEFYKVNIDDLEPENEKMVLLNNLEIASIPAFVAFKDGKVQNRVVGAVPPKLQALIRETN
ncbi:hypothetical protein H0H92_007669 [Tricholoma furcatifolium]|nr:hypothetical protein H0H92_007669 [Tricholoma furcatifolium]